MLPLSTVDSSSAACALEAFSIPEAFSPRHRVTASPRHRVLPLPKAPEASEASLLLR